ncbi:MAG: methyltransferase domain-containing protein [Pseudomonadales bacterium]
MDCVTDILVCPQCKKPNALCSEQTQLVCSACSITYPIQDGMPNLVTDPALKTLLEEIDYDAVHGVNDQRRQQLYGDWGEILDALPVGKGKLLEIGSGTGQLTWGLMHKSDFGNVFATDISAKFLNHIRTEFHAGAKNTTHYYICDANELPFKENTFDVVVGHSVLHHFLHYEQCLGAVNKILKGDGYAIFFEPVIQGKIWIAFMLDLICKMDETYKIDVLTEQEREKIQHLVKHQTKDKFIKGDKSILEKMEDKYIFDVHKLERQAHQLGYSSFSFRNYKPLNPSYRSYLLHHWMMLGIAKEKLQAFDIVFDVFKETIGALLLEQVTTPMGYLILKK